MESALMMTPPVSCASPSASADLPLAVGPAISTALLPCPGEFTPMSLVATLICNPADPALDSTVVDGARAILPSPGSAQWLFDEVAVDIPFESQDDIRAIENRLRKAHVAKITERAMRGEIEFEPALRERVALLKGLPVSVVDEVLARRITPTP